MNNRQTNQRTDGKAKLGVESPSMRLKTFNVIHPPDTTTTKHMLESNPPPHFQPWNTRHEKTKTTKIIIPHFQNDKRAEIASVARSRLLKLAAAAIRVGVQF